MTIAEKILSKASGLKEISYGEYVTAKIDMSMAHDVAAWIIPSFKETGFKKVWDNEKIVMMFDHWTPPPTVKAAEMHKIIREFVKEQKIKYFYDISEGVCHQVMVEKGHVRPGELIVGTDSHTTTYGALGAAGTGIGSTETALVWATGELWFKVPKTIMFHIVGNLPDYVTAKDLILFIIGNYGTDFAQYKSVEFTGSVIEEMSIDSRMTICNMALEMGAKFAIVPPDQKTLEYVTARTEKKFTPFKSDSDATFDGIYEVNVSDLVPQVACPYSPGNVRPITEVKEIKVDQAFLGSCTNGRVEDLEMAAKILKKRRVHPDTRMIVTPASKEVYKEALKMRLIDIFLDAGAIICNPSCGACFGAHLGLLAAGERCISSANRNFKGRMGSVDSEVYLASPAVVAASAVKGEIADPRELA